MKIARSTLLRYVAFPLGLAVAVFTVGVLTPVDDYMLGMADPRPLVIADVGILDLEAGSVKLGQTIVIVKDRIAYAGSAVDAPAMPLARRISGTGKIAMPGLWDMHIHTVGLSPQLHFPLLLANGVTSVRDMGDGCSFSGDLDCQPDADRWSKLASAGQLLAPRIVATASYHVEDVEDGIVARLYARGDRVLKLQVEDDVDPAAFNKLVGEGRQAGMQVVGHFPYGVDMLDADTGALRSIEHDSSLLPQCSRERALFDGRTQSKLGLLQRADPTRCAAVLAAMAQGNVAYVPTHVASSVQDVALLADAHLRDPRLQYIPWLQRGLWRLYAGAHSAGAGAEDHAPLRAWSAAALKLTAQAHASGVAVMAGTDAIDAYITHGFSLHDELALLVSAGLSPLDALRAATVVPIKHAGFQADFGSITTGKIADLILLNKDPLANIAHARAIDSVVFRGRLHERKDLDGMLAFVARQASSFALNCKFVWAMIKR